MGLPRAVAFFGAAMLMKLSGSGTVAIVISLHKQYWASVESGFADFLQCESIAAEMVGFIDMWPQWRSPRCIDNILWIQSRN
jgi:hypothetical protein